MELDGISYIIVAYNEEAYLPLCLKSIDDAMKGIIIPYEVIVVDNNSTDNTEKVALDWGVNWLVKEPKQGIGAARDAGYRHAKYECLAFLDADSIIPDGHWVNRMHFNLYHGVATSGPLRFYDLPAWVNWAVDWLHYPAARLFAYKWATMQGGNFAIRKSALDKVCGFDTTFSYWGEDTAIAVKLAKVGKIVMDSDMVMNTSGRRLKAHGVFRTAWNYAVNYFSVNISGKPVYKHHKDIR